MTDSTNEVRENPRKVREGIVVSDKMNSTLVVAVNERVSHPRYGKTVQRTRSSTCTTKRTKPRSVTACESRRPRPLSKLKRWRLTEIVERAR